MHASLAPLIIVQEASGSSGHLWDSLPRLLVGPLGLSESKNHQIRGTVAENQGFAKLDEARFRDHNWLPLGPLWAQIRAPLDSLGSLWRPSGPKRATKDRKKSIKNRSRISLGATWCQKCSQGVSRRPKCNPKAIQNREKMTKAYGKHTDRHLCEKPAPWLHLVNVSWMNILF